MLQMFVFQIIPNEKSKFTVLKSIKGLGGENSKHKYVYAQPSRDHCILADFLNKVLWL
jgi:hypothetical protein